MLKKLIISLFVGLVMININGMEEKKRKGDFPDYQEVKRVDTSQYKETMQNLLTKYAGEGKLDIVKFLLDSGADVNKESKEKVNINEGYFDLPLSAAAAAGNLEMVKFLVDQGANIDGDQNNPPLAWATINGNLEVVKFLIDKGANVNLQNELERTALMDAAANDHIGAVKSLINAGAKINTADDLNQTALDFAKEYGNIEVYNFLLDHGAQSGTSKAD